MWMYVNNSTYVFLEKPFIFCDSHTVGFLKDFQFCIIVSLPTSGSEQYHMQGGTRRAKQLDSILGADHRGARQSQLSELRRFYYLSAVDLSSHRWARSIFVYPTGSLQQRQTLNDIKAPYSILVTANPKTGLARTAAHLDFRLDASHYSPTSTRCTENWKFLSL